VPNPLALAPPHRDVDRPLVKPDFMSRRSAHHDQVATLGGVEEVPDKSLRTRVWSDMMRSRMILVALGVGVVAIGGGTVAVSSAWPARQPAAVTAIPSPLPVVAGTVDSGDVPIYLRGIGTVQAYNTDIIRTQVQGQITQIGFKEGQSVHAGDLLAQIDPRPYQAQLDQAIANRDRDQALLTNAQANLNRDLPLLAHGYATPQTVDQDKANAGQYAAGVKADEAMIENAQVQLGYTRITSPVNGVVGIRLIDVGNIVHPTDASGLVVVTQLQPISIVFTLPETDLPQIQQQMAEGPLAVLAYSQDDKVKLDQGTLAVLDNQIIQTSGSVRLKANFPNPAHRLWPGELVNVRLLIDNRQNALTVAATAVQQGPQGAYVYVVKPDRTVEQRAVTVGQATARQAVVDSGLKPGEQIVINGQSRLQPGSHVTLLRGRAAQELAARSAQQAVIP
jgi:multidrug efflux system membrane fusion protein